MLANVSHEIWFMRKAVRTVGALVGQHFAVDLLMYLEFVALGKATRTLRTLQELFACIRVLAVLGTLCTMFQFCHFYFTVHQLMFLQLIVFEETLFAFGALIGEFSRMSKHMRGEYGFMGETIGAEFALVQQLIAVNLYVDRQFISLLKMSRTVGTLVAPLEILFDGRSVWIALYENVSVCILQSCTHLVAVAGSSFSCVGVVVSYLSSSILMGPISISLMSSSIVSSSCCCSTFMQLTSINPFMFIQIWVKQLL